MRLRFKILISIFFVHAVFDANGQDTLTFKGQLSAYTHLNPENELPWWNGIRYIPQFNYEYRLTEINLLDFEGSVNLYGNAGIRPFDSTSFTSALKPYRLWTRYSTNQFELRAGLQKINFGSASILRPLMWFDQIDPRDPLKLTDGVWGVLARYYFMNNANAWLWGLYGNNNLKGWEFLTTKKNNPEFGGRFQTPVPKGEAGFSYHHRMADGRILSDSIITYGSIPENRFGFDAKFDMVVGWWIEASWSNFNKDIDELSNQEIINLGLDYTFGIGNGMTVIYEQLIASSEKNPFRLDNSITFSLLNISYPVGLFDSVSAIFYYDWKNNTLYNFLNWQKQVKKFTFHLMGYANPKIYNIPTQGRNEILYAGNGIQFMMVYNH